MPTGYHPVDTQALKATDFLDPNRSLSWDGGPSPAVQRQRAGATEAPPIDNPFGDGGEEPLSDSVDAYDETDPPAGHPDPEHALPAPDPGITVRPVTLADIDNLWDWIRSDPDYGVPFLGRQMATSLDLHAFFADLRTRSASGDSAVFAIDQQDMHVGFVVFDPISPTYGTALTHLYLAPEVRGNLTEILPALLGLADETFPGLSLVVSTSSASAARLYRPFGFQTTFVLQRPAGGTNGRRRGSELADDRSDSGVVDPRVDLRAPGPEAPEL